MANVPDRSGDIQRVCGCGGRGDSQKACKGVDHERREDDGRGGGEADHLCRGEAANQGTLVAVAFALLAFLLIAWNERRKVIATRLAAREALQEANNQLERKITERTTHLRASNERLKGQIRERRQAEDTLRRAQDELVQAGKLAAIGQMSTSIAHELNQPLAALRTLSGNTVRFLERGDLKVAADNLSTINNLVDRSLKMALDTPTDKRMLHADIHLGPDRFEQKLHQPAHNRVRNIERHKVLVPYPSIAKHRKRLAQEDRWSRLWWRPRNPTW